MNRIILGAVSARRLAGAGLFWWQGQAAIDASAPDAPQMSDPEETGLPIEELPSEDGNGMEGTALPGANNASREEKRFNRLDRNRDNLVTRIEALQPRVAAFYKLDTDHKTCSVSKSGRWSARTGSRKPMPTAMAA